MPVMPTTSVRGRIRAYIERHAEALGTNVLEVGSNRGFAGAWFRDNRDLARGKWLGIDFQDGPGVDRVMDVHKMPADWSDRFSGLLISEVLEHLRDPIGALAECRRVMQPNALIIVTTLFAFPEHGFPDDYYRYSRAGLEHVLHQAGFGTIAAEYGGTFTMSLNDHGEDGLQMFAVPIHTFATARK
jgi:SAM-dependent methyltransferase